MISLSISDDQSDNDAVQLVGCAGLVAQDATASKDRAAVAAEPPSLAALLRGEDDCARMSLGHSMRKVDTDVDSDVTDVAMDDVVDLCSSDDEDLRVKREIALKPSGAKRELAECDRNTGRRKRKAPARPWLSEAQLDHLNTLRVPADRTLQKIVWQLGCEVNLYQHQPEAVRAVAGTEPTECRSNGCNCLLWYTGCCGTLVRLISIIG